jgi:hypothetical protein
MVCAVDTVCSLVTVSWPTDGELRSFNSQFHRTVSIHLLWKITENILNEKREGRMYAA